MSLQQDRLAQEVVRQPRGLVQARQHISIAQGGPLQPGILNIGLTIYSSWSLCSSCKLQADFFSFFLFTGKPPTGSIDYSRFVPRYSGYPSPHLTHINSNGATQERNQVSMLWPSSFSMKHS